MEASCALTRGVGAKSQSVRVWDRPPVIRLRSSGNSLQVKTQLSRSCWKGQHSQMVSRKHGLSVSGQRSSRAPPAFWRTPYLEVELGLGRPVPGMQSTLIPHSDVAVATRVHVVSGATDGHCIDFLPVAESADLPGLMWGPLPNHHVIWNGRLGWPQKGHSLDLLSSMGASLSYPLTQFLSLHPPAAL